MSRRRREPTPVTSVYVHAPFCARRCVYCDFAVTVRRTGDVDGWIGAIEAELGAVAREGLFVLEDRLRTLYVGGGTPSLLGPTAMHRLADVIGRDRLAGAGLEWTAEANPESLTPAVADAWARAGVNRLSLGAQTFSEAALRWMGRLHGPSGPARAVEVARGAGVTNLSVDLIFALPASVDRSWDEDLARLLELDVPHVSLYGLTVEPGTPLASAVDAGRETGADDDRYRDEYLRAAEALTSAGYDHYEVSNFARPGFEARHNAVYWSGAPYLGLGNGAHSYAAPLRRWNVRDWETYRIRSMSGQAAEEGREEVTPEAGALERTWLGLRTASGIAAPAPGSEAATVVDRWIAQGLAEPMGGRVRLTAHGWLLLDRLTVELDAARAEPAVGLHSG